MEKQRCIYGFRCPVGTNNLQKLQKLCRRAGIDTIDMKGKFVAIKMHFGELGCLASIRPQYVKAVADLVKELGDVLLLLIVTRCILAVASMRWNTWIVPI